MKVYSVSKNVFTVSATRGYAFKLIDETQIFKQTFSQRIEFYKFANEETVKEWILIKTLSGQLSQIPYKFGFAPIQIHADGTQI